MHALSTACLSPPLGCWCLRLIVYLVSFLFHKRGKQLGRIASVQQLAPCGFGEPFLSPVVVVCVRVYW